MAQGHHTPHGTGSATSFDVTLYDLTDGDPVEVHVDQRSGQLWATQAQIAALFDTDRTSITKHLSHLLETGEIDEASMCADSSHVGGNARTYVTRLYNLDAVLAVGFRVNSTSAVAFRKWARDILARYQRDGYVLDHDRLESDVTAARRLTDEIAAIRASNRGITATLGDLLRLLCYDYQSGSKMIASFYAAMNDLMTYGVTGMTAAEVILARCVGSLPTLGVVSFKGSRPTRAEVETARNYLTARELRQLNRLVLAWTLTVESYADNDNLRNGSDLVDAFRDTLRGQACSVFPGYMNGYRKLDASRHLETEFGKWKSVYFPHPKRSRRALGA